MSPIASFVPEAFCESAGGKRGIAERKPNDDRALVREGSLGSVPDDVGDAARFVENQNDNALFVVQAGKRLSVVFRPWN